MCGGLFIDIKNHRKTKDAALARFAFNLQVATHQFHQPGRDGKPKPGAAKFASGRGIGLREGFKNVPELLGRDADTGVAHCETQRRGSVMACINADAAVNLSVCCELDGIAKQIEQHLAQTCGVAPHAARHIGGKLAMELQPLAQSRRAHRLQGLGHRFLHVKRHPLHRQLAGLNLREIKNVIKDHQQRGGR